MIDEIFAIDPIQKKKKSPSIELFAAPLSAPFLLGKAAADATLAKSVSIVTSHFQSMGEIISENIHRNIEEKKEWKEDDLRIQKRIRPNFLYFSLKQANFLHRNIAQIL